MLNFYILHLIKVIKKRVNIMNNTSLHVENPINEHNTHENYTLFLVFKLPEAVDVASHSGKLITPPEEFLIQCIHNAKIRNQKNLTEDIQHSKDYFTDLNHAERHRIPSTLHRLNTELAPNCYGIISFSVFKDEQVKNKVYNQRTSSVNPMVIELERVKQIYYPLSYKTENFIKLNSLGEMKIIEQEGFCLIDIAESVIKKARELAS